MVNVFDRLTPRLQFYLHFTARNSSIAIKDVLQVIFFNVRRQSSYEQRHSSRKKFKESLQKFLVFRAPSFFYERRRKVTGFSGFDPARRPSTPFHIFEREKKSNCLECLSENSGSKPSSVPLQILIATSDKYVCLTMAVCLYTLSMNIL